MSLSDEHRRRLIELTRAAPQARLTAVLQAAGIATSSWYRQPVPAEERRRPGPRRKPIREEVVRAVVEMATANPWYGYKKIAIMCRRRKMRVKNREAY